MMRYLLFVGHGKYAEGVRSAVEMLMGERDWMRTCSMSADADFDACLVTALEGVASADECVLLADIAGGSPERRARTYLQGLGIPDGQVLGFGGVNLAMALSAVMGIEDGLDLASIGDALLSEGQQAVRRL